MSEKIVLISTATCNLYSITNAFRHFGIDIVVSSDINDIADAERLVLPGVGAFGNCANSLRKAGLFAPIKEHIRSGLPFLGICVGMQLMFEYGYENGEHTGLAIIPGEVIPIDEVISKSSKHKIPHIGWYKLMTSSHRQHDTLLQAVSENDSMFFVHSFMVNSIDPNNMIAWYKVDKTKIPALVKYKKAYGCQFHPEKSGSVGLRLLKNFLTL